MRQKKIIMSFCLLVPLLGCRPTSRQQMSDVESVTSAEANIIKVTSAEWDKLAKGSKSPDELGCVCEQTGSDWQLFRYASIGSKFYKVSLMSAGPIDGCIKSKFDEANCKLKF